MRKFQVVIGGRGRKNMSALAWQICLIFIRTKLCIFSSNLPEEWMEFIFISVFLEIIQNLYLIAICLEVCPYIPVDWNYYFTFQIFCHTKDIDRCHFILHTDGIFSK